MPSILGVSGLDFRRFWGSFSIFLAYFGHVFRHVWACREHMFQGGKRYKTICFKFIRTRDSRKPFKLFAKRIQELAEDKAENKLRIDSLQHHQTTKFRSSKLLFVSQTSRYQKMGGGTPRQGASMNYMSHCDTPGFAVNSCQKGGARFA